MTDTPLSAPLGAPLGADVLDALRTFDTPTICNAVELLIPERQGFGFTYDPLFCARPQLPPMVGYARTAKIRSSKPSALGADETRRIRLEYYRHVAEGPKPSIIVIEDIDEKPAFGSFWGEVQSNVHKGLGALGTVTNGCVRDLVDSAEGFQFIAAQPAPSHAYVHVVEYAVEVSVAGMSVKPGDLVHADLHGAVVVPHEIAAQIPATVALLARREAVIIGAAQQPGYDFDKLAAALKSAAEIH